MELEKIRNIAHKKMKILQERLSDDFDEQFRLYLVGSLQTGLFNGPKRSIFSPNAERCPFSSIIEIDLRLVLERASPHDALVIEKIRKVLDVQNYEKKYTDHWYYTNVPMTVFYWYENLAHDVGLEWEFCINRNPWIEIACYWDRLFTSEERQWQKELRNLVTSVEVPLHLYVPFKQRQGAEARWRMVAIHALTTLIKSGMSERCPHISDIEQNSKYILDFLAKRWIDGESGYRSLERTASYLPEEVFKILELRHGGFYVKKFLKQPSEPDWVTYADELQKKLKNNHANTQA